MTGPGERLVTVVLTVVVPTEADAEVAAGLVADAAVSTALQVVSAAGVEGHLPVPGSLVLCRDGGQPWRVGAVSKEFANLTAAPVRVRARGRLEAHGEPPHGGVRVDAGSGDGLVVRWRQGGAVVGLVWLVLFLAGGEPSLVQ